MHIGKVDQRSRGNKMPTSTSAPRARRLACPLSAVLVLLAAGMGGCDEGATPSLARGARVAAATPTARTLNLMDGPGASLGKYRMYWPKRAQQEVNDRIAKSATVLRGKRVGVTSPSLINLQPSKPLDDDKLLVSYDADYDTLWVRDEEVLKPGKSTSDVGEAKARAAMKSVFGDFVTAGLLDARHYDPKDVQTGHHRRLAFTDGNPDTQEFVVEYRFRMLRKLNGIDLPNNGILIGIAPSGRRSSIKIGGVQVESVDNGIEEVPVLSDGVLSRKVATQDLQKRFDKEVRPGKRKDISWNKLMYVMPKDARDAVVEPSMVYRFSAISTNSQGDELVEPVELYAFSLVDPNKPAANLFPEKQ
jgi:hypothetical protein